MSAPKLTYSVNDPDLRQRFFDKILPETIDTLDENDKPEWGEMSAQHMVEHLCFIFQVSTNSLEVECYTPEEKRAKLQAFLNTNRPMPKDYINPVTGTELPDLQFSKFATAKEKLKKEIQNFLTYYKKNPNLTQTNPTFGELDAEKWRKFHFKHCFHHLLQFGLVIRKD